MEKKTAEQSFEEHFDKFRHGIFRSSLDHFLETGRLSGSLLQSVREHAAQFHKQETEAVQDTQEKPDCPNCAALQQERDDLKLETQVANTSIDLLSGQVKELEERIKELGNQP